MICGIIFHIIKYGEVPFIPSYDNSSFLRIDKVKEDIGYVPPNIDDTNFENFIITNKNFDETWTSVINFLNGSSFNIKNLDKDYGFKIIWFKRR